ncbi:MAG: type II CAAX endopeptidase family protein [Candidatus Angelobacter sp.]
MADNEPALAESVPQPPIEQQDTMTLDDQFAARLRGFGPIGIVAILVILLTGNVFIGKVIVPVGAVLVLVWMKWSRTPWRKIGYVQPRSWVVTVAAGCAFGIALKFLLKAIVMPLLGADPINHAFHYWVGNRAILPAAVWICLVAGFAEETIFRGYGFERMGKLLGRSARAKTLMVLVTSVLFGLAHYQLQGLAGTEQAAIVGLVFGSIFACTGQIWMLMFAHTAFDLTALVLIYSNLETRVAHLVFR